MKEEKRTIQEVYLWDRTGGGEEDAGGSWRTKNGGVGEFHEQPIPWNAHLKLKTKIAQW